MEAADNGQIEICIGASSYANADTSGLAKSTEACFEIEIIDEDTMPPLFCSAAELQANNFEARDHLSSYGTIDATIMERASTIPIKCYPELEIIEIFATDVAVGFELPMDDIRTAVDGDLGRDGITILDYNIVSQTPL